MWIAIAVLGLLLLLLLSNLRFVFSYTEERGFLITLRFLFLRFSLTDKKPKKQKRKKKKKKQGTTSSPSGAPAAEKSEGQQGSSALGFSDIKYFLRVLRSLVRFVLKKASRHVRLRFKRLHITVSGEDAALVAIEYGAVISLVSYFIALTEEKPYWKGQRRDAFSVSVNYLERNWQFSLLGEIKCRVLFAIPLVISLLRRGVASMSLLKRNRKKPTTVKTDENQ